MRVPGQSWHDGVFLGSLIRRDCGMGGEGSVDQTTAYIPYILVFRNDRPSLAGFRPARIRNDCRW